MKRRETPWLIDPSDKEILGLKLAHIVYLLQVGCFSSLMGFFINHFTFKEIKGTWLESHYRWQMRTFCYSCGLAVVGFLLAIVGIGVLIWFAIVPFVLYRVVMGWLALWKGEEIGCCAYACPCSKDK